MRALVSGKVFNDDFQQQWMASLRPEDPAAPDGKKIQDDAVQPNVVVASNDDEDGGAPAAANAPVNKLNPPKVPSVPKAAPDDQLNKALDVLKAKAA